MFIASNIFASNEEEWNDAMTYYIFSKALRQQRYLMPRAHVPKSNWAAAVLPQPLETRFRNYVRMNRFSLKHIADLIREDSVFLNKANS